jgi:hypothetical protein
MIRPGSGGGCTSITTFSLNQELADDGILVDLGEFDPLL